MKRLIKNYTTAIPVERTIAEIQKLLAQNGARGIALQYDESGTIKDIFFKIMLNNQELPFRLPAKAERVYQAVWGERRDQEQRALWSGVTIVLPTITQMPDVAIKIVKLWGSSFVTRH
jgi:tRNA nucleotidyltransferase/poly(A) polymerase